VNLDHVLFEDNRGVSVFLQGAVSTVSHVHILDTGPGEGGFALGIGLAAVHCTDLSYAKLMIRGAPEGANPATIGAGALVHASSARPVGSGADEKGIIIIDGKRGVWLQAIGTPPQEPQQTVVLDGLDVQGALTAALGFDLGARGIIIIDGKIGATAAFEGPAQGTDPNGDPFATTANLGIGLVWKAASSAIVESLEVGGSETHSVIIDGAVGADSAIHALAQSGGDEQMGVVQQNVEAMDAAPQTDASGPMINRTADPLTVLPPEFDVPAPLP
jgi:hypothetical protein